MDTTGGNAEAQSSKKFYLTLIEMEDFGDVLLVP